MNEWPEGWFRDEKPASGGAGGGISPGAAGAAGAGVPGEPTEQLPVGAAGAPSAAGAYARPAGQRGRAGAWPEQPPLHAEPRTGQRPPAGAPRPPAGRPQPGRGGRRTGRSRTRRVLLIAGIVVLVLLIVIGAMYFYLDSQLNRRDVLVDYPGRPAAGAGQNWLITGSDSRRGLTAAQKRQLHTGFDAVGHRSDTVLVLHIPSNGRAVLISLPRDSFVQIPGYGGNKLNAAFSFGGPRLLAKTVQNATGLRIDHYMQIGFGGLVNVVDAVGGVRMCLPGPINDPASGLNLKAGCQTLDGAEALGYVRTRHNFNEQDLQRVQDQRLFLRALLRKTTSPGTLLNPFAAVPAAFGATNALTVDTGTHLYQLMQAALALRNPQTTTVPIASANYVTAAGDSVLWDSARAKELFSDLNHDRPVPKNLLSGSHQSAQ